MTLGHQQLVGSDDEDANSSGVGDGVHAHAWS